VSLSLTLVKVKKIEYHIRKKTYKFVVLKLWLNVVSIPCVWVELMCHCCYIPW